MIDDSIYNQPSKMIHDTINHLQDSTSIQDVTP